MGAEAVIERTASGVWWWCPGCHGPHRITVPGWTVTGPDDAPTFHPSVFCNPNDPQTRCHSYVKAGKIEFLNDCHHALAGKTVQMEPWEMERLR